METMREFIAHRKVTKRAVADNMRYRLASKAIKEMARQIAEQEKTIKNATGSANIDNDIQRCA